MDNIQKIKFALLDLYENINEYTKGILEEETIPAEKRDAIAAALAKVTEAAACLLPEDKGTGPRPPLL